jgi:sec-independent protein translocase protein TatB
MDLEELKKMKETMETAARDVEQTVQTTASDFEKDWADTTAGLSSDLPNVESAPPYYKRPEKNWRLKRGAMPQWYKARSGVRTKALSGAARVARYRPKPLNSV